MIAERNPKAGKTVFKLRELSADERARDLYERREKARRDMAAQQKWAIKKSMFEVARNAWQMNMPIGDIVKLTGLTVEEVESQCIKQ